MTWHFIHVVPNLVLPPKDKAQPPFGWPDGIDLGSDELAIVAGTDTRILEARASTPAVEQILSSFRDQYGNPYSPAVLIATDAAVKAKWFSEEAVVAFRNAIALAVLLKGRAAAARGVGGMSPTWSDTFDFHPAQLSVSSRMVLNTPAITAGVSVNAHLNLTPSPYVPLEGQHIWPDEYLYRALGLEWKRRFASLAGNDQFARSLFRSLEVAYTACAVGAKNEQSIHDYGLQVALWVSAIEILAWPTGKNAGLEEVLALLRRAPLDPSLANRVYQAKFRKREKPRRLNAIERSYSYLYKARNSFLHGNPVSAAMLFTKGKKVSSPTPRIAAVVYRAALAAYLDDRYPVSMKTLEEIRERSREVGERSNYDKALAEMFGRKLPSI